MRPSPAPVPAPIEPTWDAGCFRLLQAVVAHDWAEAQTALARGANPLAWHGLDEQGWAVESPLLRLLQGTAPTAPPGTPVVDVALLDLLLQHAPPDWASLAMGQQAFGVAANHGVRNLGDVLEVMLQHGFTPRCVDLIGTLRPEFYDDAQPEPTLDLVPAWDRLWAHLPAEERDAFPLMAPLQWFGEGILHPLERQRARWLIGHGASLRTPYYDPAAQAKVTLATVMQDREALEDLQRHEASILDQRLSQILGGVKRQAQGHRLGAHEEAAMLQAYRHLEQIWPNLPFEFQDSLRQAVPLQWFTRPNLNGTALIQAAWFIEHGASLLTPYAGRDAQGQAQPTTAFEAMADTEARNRLVGFEQQCRQKGYTPPTGAPTGLKARHRRPSSP